MTTSTLRTAILVGGGIGGLCAAIALRQRGIGATVYERAEELGDVGAGLVLASNAMRALGRLGLAEATIAAGSVVTLAQIRTAAGAVLTETDMRLFAARFGAPSVAIHRAALHRVLRTALPAEAIVLGATCAGFEGDESGVTARFADGSARRADLLIGADGLGSAIRRQLFPEVALRRAGYSAWRGAVETADESALGITSESWGRGRRFGIVRIDPQRVYWFATENAGAASSRDRVAEKERLLTTFAGWHRPIGALLAATPAEAILHNDIADFAPLARWSVGRVTLLGDAAHATTPNLGQGACMAIESAEVLARCLAEEAEIPAALAAYEARRRPRTAFITESSRRIGRVAQWANPVACALRDFMVRQFAARSADRQLAKVLGGDA